MIRAPLSTTSVLDETSDAVALAAAPWAAVLVLTSLPYRFLQVLFLEQLIEVGNNASHYGNALSSTANATCLAFAFSLLGRAVYARAINLAAASGRRPALEALRVPLTALAAYLFTASLFEFLFYATWFTIIGIPLTIMVSGLAVGTMPLNDRASLLAPLRRIGRFAREAKTLTALLLVFFIALFVAMGNIAAAFGIGLWLVHGFGGFDISRWQLLLGLSTRRFDLLLVAGAIVAVEPFWVAANVILVRKAGAEETGEELRLWFRELKDQIPLPSGEGGAKRRVRGASVALMLALLLAPTLHAAPVIPVAQYLDSLTRIQSLLAANQPDPARAAARELAACEVDSPNGRFSADTALLGGIAATGRADGRLAATITALRKTLPASAQPPVDRKLFERLRASEAVPELKAGGEVTGVPISQDPRVDTFANKVGKVLAWIWKKIEQFYDWLMSWWPHERIRDVSSSFGGTPWLVAAVVILIVGILTILALEVARRSKRRLAVPIAESDPVASRRDEDPLSRGANEWERYAAQLAEAGRIREAIRAWYHAVLVTLYSAGILHFRKGRTNWEYVSALSPELGWRGEFVQLTRRFEEEWYGHDASGIDALDDCSGRAQSILESVRRGRGLAA